MKEIINFFKGTILTLNQLSSVHYYLISKEECLKAWDKGSKHFDFTSDTTTGRIRVGWI